MAPFKHIGPVQALALLFLAVTAAILLLLVDSVRDYTRFRLQFAPGDDPPVSDKAAGYAPQHVPPQVRYPFARMNIFQPGRASAPAKRSGGKRSGRNGGILGVIRRDRLFLVVTGKQPGKTRLVAVGGRLDNGDEVAELYPDRVVLKGTDGRSVVHKIFSYQEVVKPKKREK